jgi:hypothetical protein
MADLLNNPQGPLLGRMPFKQLFNLIRLNGTTAVQGGLNSV